MASLFGSKSSKSGAKAPMSKNNLEQHLFNVLYFLQKDTSYHILYFVATGIQFCHLLNNAFIETTFAWNHSVITDSGFGRALHYITFELFMVGEAAFYVMFFMTTAVILLLLGLTVFMSSALSSGNVPPQRLSRFVQFLVSVMIAFEGPISRILMAMVECDYGYTGRNPYWGWECFASPGRVVLYILSILLMLTFIALIVVFSFMHAFNPKSRDACTRTGSWIDMVNSMFQIVTVIFFRLAWRSPFVLSVYFLLGGSLMLTLVVFFQPFYRSSMNCFRAAIHAATAWTGFCLVCVTLVDNPNSAIVSTMFLSVFPLVLWHGWYISKRYLDRRLAEADSMELSEDTAISNDGIIDRLRSPPMDKESESWRDMHGASIVEQRTRFLQLEQNPDLLDRAELILRTGLRQFPLSEYLLMRYVTFIIIYRNDMVLANLIINQCLRADFTDIESRLDIYRLHKDLQRARQAGSNAQRQARGVDIISFEEAQKTLRTARACHRQAHDQMQSLLQDIARGKATAANVAKRAETIYTNEEHALECFELLMAQSEDSAEVYISFGNFLKDVMLDGQAADSMFQMANGCRAAGPRDDNSEKGMGSNHSAQSSKFSRMARLKEIVQTRDEKLKRLSWKMRGITLMLVAIIVAVFCIYYFISAQFVESLLNLNDSGTRSTAMLTTPYNVRTMHLAALLNDSAMFENARQRLNVDMYMSRVCHHNLVFTYRTTYDRQRRFLENPSVQQYLPSFEGFVNTTLTGDDTVSKFLQHADVLANATMDDFLSVQVNDTTSYLSFFYVMSNWFNAHLAMDQSTTLYQLEAERFGYYSFLGIVLSSVLAALVETAVVVFIFHPAVKQLFEQFQASVLNIQKIGPPEAKAALAAGVTAAIAGGDDAPHEEAVSITMETPRGKTRTMSDGGGDTKELSICIENPASGPFSNTLTSPSEATPTRGSASPRRQQQSPSRIRERQAMRIWTTSTNDNVRRTAQSALDAMEEPSAEKNEAQLSPRRRSRETSGSALRVPGTETADDDSKSGDGDMVSEASSAVEPDINEDMIVGDVDSRPEPPGGKRNSLTKTLAMLPGGKDAKADPSSEAATGSGPAGSAAAAKSSSSDDLFGSEKLESTRKRRIQVLYSVSLLLVVSALVGFCVYGALAVNKSVQVAVELNTVSRCSDVISRLSIVSREYAYSNNNDTSLRGSKLPVFDDLEHAQPRLTNNSRGALMSHTAFLYGFDAGFVKLPAANGWPQMKADTPFSPYTRIPDLFKAGNRCKGGVKNEKSLSNILFENNCLTQLEWRDSSDRASQNARVQFLAQTLDNNQSRCTYRNNDDSLVIGGYHAFFEEIIRGYLRLAAVPQALLHEAHPAYLFLDHYTNGSPEFKLGTRKLMLEVQRSAMTRIDDTVVTMVMFLAIVGAVVLVQYFVLGRQLSNILSQNLGMEGVVKRLVNHCDQYQQHLEDEQRKDSMEFKP